MLNFTIASLPLVHFGAGKIEKIVDILEERTCTKVLFITGSGSFRNTTTWQKMKEILAGKGVTTRDFICSGEPSPGLVDGIVSESKNWEPDAVVSIGGGSVIDAGKAVSAMLRAEGSVQDYLEGVGSRKPTGEKVFFIAAPTTAGTGSEATKNAVISRPGPEGFKKSLRHDSYVPDVAVIDPNLALSCPRGITAASGLDAIVQLVESYVSTGASIWTDSLAVNGLSAAGQSFQRSVAEGDKDISSRSLMAYAAFVSGVTLANAGLGVVHGIAGYMGGRYPISHGDACGTLMVSATERIIDKLFAQEKENNIPLMKYGEAAKLLLQSDYGSLEYNCNALINTLSSWTKEYNLPRLSSCGVTEEDIPDIVKGSGRKNTPVELTDEDLAAIISDRL